MKVSRFEERMIKQWKREGMSRFEIMAELREYRWQRDNG